MRIIKKENAGQRPVYDLGVPPVHSLLLANGTVAHNCFNKSHSIAYSIITYQCAWLKANYPLEFFCALMTVRSDSLQPKKWAEKAPEYINEAKQLGVHIHAPSVNTSDIGFQIRDSEIYFGLSAIRDVGKGAARAIINARGRTPFKSIDDFIQRVNLQSINTKHFEALIKAGAFDRLGYPRQQLLEQAKELYAFIRAMQDKREREVENTKRTRENVSLKETIDKRNELRKIKNRKRDRDLTAEEEEFLENAKGVRLHAMLKIPETITPPEIPRARQITLGVEDLMLQAEYIGCYIGVHPATILFPRSVRIHSAEEGERQVLAGVVTRIKVIQDRNRRDMAFVEFGDGTGIAEGVIFSSVYNRLLLRDKIPEAGDVIEAQGPVDSIDPTVKMKIFGIEKHRRTT